MLRVLLRLGQCLLLTVFMGQLTGFVPPAERDDCEENCPFEHEEEGSDEGCAQSCHLCACCPSLRITHAAPSVAVSPQTVIGRVEWILGERPSLAEPREIFHVPKHRSA